MNVHDACGYQSEFALMFDKGQKHSRAGLRQLLFCFVVFKQLLLVLNISL